MNHSWRLRGLTEADWLTRTDPLRMPKVFHRPPYRKCAFLTCAYVLNSPGGFRHPFARRVAEALQRAVVASPFPTDLAAALRGKLDREFPGDLSRTNYHGQYGAVAERASELGAERYAFGAFLYALTGSKPSRGGVNHVAEYCLGQVRSEAHAAAQQKLEALRGERNQIAAAVRSRFLTHAAETAVAAAGAVMADLVREVFGNPFRPPEIDPQWRWSNHGAAWHIAAQIAATGNFADMPILAGPTR
jgi:hypothetical protein